MKILLVEDEEMLNSITAKYLRAENMTVDTCFNGQQAIDYVNTSSYDVIVMDIMMPILDGISALAQMRNDGNTTPVLLLTAKDSLQDKVTGLNTGADDYLVKPFDLEELTARIYCLLYTSTACMLAQAKDVILVAGKGHENYQEIKGIKHHFDDKEVLRDIFANE